MRLTLVRLLHDQRGGSVFVEFLQVIPLFVVVFVLGQRIAFTVRARAEVEARLATCALAHAVDGCARLRPLVCLGATLDVTPYGDGAEGPDLDGDELNASYRPRFASLVGARARYRISCNARRGLRELLSTRRVVHKLCSLSGGPRACSMLIFTLQYEW